MIYLEVILASPGSFRTAKGAYRWLSTRGVEVNFLGVGNFPVTAQCSEEVFDNLKLDNPCEYITVIKPISFNQ
jgi:hypothetical protein